MVCFILITLEPIQLLHQVGRMESLPGHPWPSNDHVSHSRSFFGLVDVFSAWSTFFWPSSLFWLFASATKKGKKRSHWLWNWLTVFWQGLTVFWRGLTVIWRGLTVFWQGRFSGWILQTMREGTLNTDLAFMLDWSYFGLEMNYHVLRFSTIHYKCLTSFKWLYLCPAFWPISTTMIGKHSCLNLLLSWLAWLKGVPTKCTGHGACALTSQGCNAGNGLAGTGQLTWLLIRVEEAQLDVPGGCPLSSTLLHIKIFVRHIYVNNGFSINFLIFLGFLFTLLDGILAGVDGILASSRFRARAIYFLLVKFCKKRAFLIKRAEKAYAFWVPAGPEK